MPIQALSSALTGLKAAETRVGNTANNIANHRTVGKVDAQNPDEAVYEASDVTQSALETGGTKAKLVSRDPKSLVAYDPGSPLANDEGLVEAPNVDLGRELTDLIQAENSYKASLKALQTAGDLEDEVLDIKA